jgi:hypothetical protein
MWITRPEYTELIAARASSTATIQWLTARVNQLERKNAMLEAKLGLPPTDVPEITMIPTSPTPLVVPASEGRIPELPTMRDIFAGNVNFEDMGDQRARELGIN